jgi:hypothetical protein
MTAPDSQSRQREGVRIACAVARDLGLSCDDPAVLVERSNLLVHLRPAPVVARVATRIGQMRPGVASLAREVAITRFLAAAGAPVVPPSREVDPGPLERGGLALAFFEYSPDSGEPADAQATGRALRACHEWDLACLVATARVHGTEVERAGRALAAHGATPRSELLDLLVVARAFQTTVWAALFARDWPAVRGHIAATVEFLRAR